MSGESRIEEVRRLAAIGTAFEEPLPEPPAMPDNIVSLSAVRKARRLRAQLEHGPDAA